MSAHAVPIMSFIHLKDFLQQSLRTSPMYLDSAWSTGSIEAFVKRQTLLAKCNQSRPELCRRREKKKLQYFSQSRWSMLYQLTHFYASAAAVVINFLQSVWKPTAENNFRSPLQLQK